jgi:hypothetical protein
MVTQLLYAPEQEIVSVAGDWLVAGNWDNATSKK